MDLLPTEIWILDVEIGLKVKTPCKHMTRNADDKCLKLRERKFLKGCSETW